MSFRQRLALFLVAAVVCVQVMTAALTYSVVRRNLVAQGTRELRATASVFTRQLNILSERVTNDVRVLSLDYALRKAVAEHDEDTAQSALRNHGQRIGASRMMLIGLDGNITTDTARREAASGMFPFPDLLNTATLDDQGTATALAVLDGVIYWIVVLPIRAPVPIAFVAACVPVDNALLEKLRALSPIPQSLALATPGKTGWSIVAKTAGFVSNIALGPYAGSSNDAVITTEEHGDNLAMRARLPTAIASAPVFAILDYPLDQVLSTYRVIIMPMLLVFAGALAAALAGAMLIARGVAQPLEALAAAAGRIAKGDYAPLPAVSRGDEIGQLSLALGDMTRSIAEREAALKTALAAVELARNEAVKANDAKSQFLSNMSHELRTPLNAIIGFSELIYTQVMGPIANARYVDYARHVHESGHHLLTDVEEMLDLAQAETGALALSRETVKAGEILASAAAAVVPAAEKAGIILDLPTDLARWPVLEADRAKLQQSLGNLLDNAIKFSHRGTRVSVHGTVRDDVLEIVIADQGAGIAEADLAVVLRPFHRQQRAFDARHQGAGLGLPFAKTIIEAHGGTLRLVSREGVGTTVTIALCLTAALSAPKAARGAPFTDAA